MPFADPERRRQEGRKYAAKKRAAVKAARPPAIPKPQPTTKCCRRCLVEKPVLDFHPVVKKGTLHSRCKPCRNIDAAESFLRNHAVYLARARERNKTPERREAEKRRNSTPEGKLRRQATYQRQYAVHPERRKARIAVTSAIGCGRLHPGPCMVCGEKAEAHHPDYSRPLDIVWLCKSHHVEVHAMARASVSGEAL